MSGAGAGAAGGAAGGAAAGAAGGQMAGIAPNMGLGQQAGTAPGILPGFGGGGPMAAGGGSAPAAGGGAAPAGGSTPAAGTQTGSTPNPANTVPTDEGNNANKPEMPDFNKQQFSTEGEYGEGWKKLANEQRNSFLQYINETDAAANFLKDQVRLREKENEEKKKKKEQESNDEEFLKMIDYVNAAKKQNELKNQGTGTNTQVTK